MHFQAACLQIPARNINYNHGVGCLRITGANIPKILRNTMYASHNVQLASGRRHVNFVINDRLTQLLNLITYLFMMFAVKCLLNIGIQSGLQRCQHCNQKFCKLLLYL